MSLMFVIISIMGIAGQKPGTSGLRKSTATFMGPNYLQNFVQATLDALPAEQLAGGTLVVSGDGRYFCPEATQVVIKMAVAAGVDRLWVGVDGLLSTPAVSAVIRNRKPAEVATDGSAVPGGTRTSRKRIPGWSPSTPRLCSKPACRRASLGASSAVPACASAGTAIG